MTDLTHRVQYFLGANSGEGFSSLYGQWVDQTSIQAFYILKGGAGCGKSTLMGQVARTAEKEGYVVEYIRCSGDPDSLDGVLIPQKGAALMDGTAPHAAAPLGHPGIKVSICKVPSPLMVPKDTFTGQAIKMTGITAQVKGMIPDSRFQ